MTIGQSDYGCPLCGQVIKPAQAERNQCSPETYRTFDCPTCGQFDLSDSALTETRQTLTRRPMLPSYVAEQHTRGTIPFFFSKPEQSMAWRNNFGDSEIVPVLLRDAISLFPITVSHRLDRILLRLADVSNEPGAWLPIELSENALSFYSEGGQSFDFLLLTLEQQQLVEFLRNSSQRARPLKLRLTATGWNRVAEFENGRTGDRPYQAFIAWSDDRGVLGEADREGFRVAIRAAGYDPLHISAEEFPDDINDRVLAELRRSRFVVADLTGQRQNVYFEAGFATGVGLTVFYTCRQGDEQNLHFSARNRNVLIWNGIEELSARLQNRIGAVLGRPVRG